MKFAFTAKSLNRKTGPMPVTMTTRDSCPKACPLRGKGCYAEAGWLGMHWRKIARGGKGLSLSQFLAAIRTLPKGTLWRHNQAGDLPGDGKRIDVAKLGLIIGAASGTRGFTYTHYPMTDAANRKAVAMANACAALTINLSANNLTEADELAALDVGPVAVVLPSHVDGASTRTLQTPQGRRVVVCPATYRDEVTCASCGLCAVKKRPIIGFPAHGSSRLKVSRIAEGH